MPFLCMPSAIHKRKYFRIQTGFHNIHVQNALALQIFPIFSISPWVPTQHSVKMGLAGGTQAPHCSWFALLKAPWRGIIMLTIWGAAQLGLSRMGFMHFKLQELITSGAALVLFPGQRLQTHLPVPAASAMIQRSEMYCQGRKCELPQRVAFASGCIGHYMAL